MKRVLVGDERDGLVTTLETFIRHWGYRVTASSRSDSFLTLLREIEPDLLIVGSAWLGDKQSALYECVADHVVGRALPLLTLAGAAKTEIPLPHEELPTPLDIFALYPLIQRHLEKIPRRHPRLSLQIPGLVCRGENRELAEVVSLSRQGLFIKTPLRMREGEQLQLILPLVGMRKELEISSQVLYCIHPGPDNNYLQGFGLGFVEPDPEHLEILETYIESRIFGEVNTRQPGLDLLTEDHLHCRTDRAVLRFVGNGTSH